MAVASFLHIHRAGDRAVRAVALMGDEARVGRGPLCEVQLDTGIGSAVHLVLKRRGEFWSVKPIGAARDVRLDGEPIRETVRLHPGGVLEVGDYRLTLVHINPSPAAVEPGSFSRPITLESGRTPSPAPTAVSQPGFRNEPRPSTPWAATPIAPPAPRKTPPTSPAAKPPQEVRPTVERTPSWRTPDDRTRAWLESRRAFHWPEGLVTPRPPQPPHGSALSGRPASPPRASSNWTPPPRHPVSPTTWPEPTNRSDRESTREPSRSPIATPPRLDAIPHPSPDWLDPEEQAARQAWVSSATAVEPDTTTDFVLPDDFDTLTQAPEIASGSDTGAAPDDPSVGPSARKPRESRAWHFGDATPRDAEPIPPPPTPEPTDLGPTASEPETEHWPSIASIWTRTIESAAPRRARDSRRGPSVPSPTALHGPNEWRVPLWLGLPTLVAALLLVGGGSVALTYVWSQDARVAGPVANYWTAGDVQGGTIRFPQLPNPSWWATTTDALVLHAATLAATARDALDREDQRTLLDLAAGASPTNPGVRFARQALDRAAPKNSPAAVASRDVASLAAAAIQDLAAGRRSSGIERLVDALALSARLEPEDAEYPALDREANGLRLELPQEEVVGHLLRTGGGEFARAKVRWEEVMPDHAGPWMALYRWRRSASRSEAISILERVGSLPTYPAGGDAAWHQAARAEALAAASRWSEAAETYRATLALKPGPLLASVVWFNLADVLTRLGQVDAAREARRISRQLAANLPDRPRDQARRLHETLDGDGPVRTPSF